MAQACRRRRLRQPGAGQRRFRLHSRGNPLAGACRGFGQPDPRHLSRGTAAGASDRRRSPRASARPLRRGLASRRSSRRRPFGLSCTDPFRSVACRRHVASSRRCSARDQRQVSCAGMAPEECRGAPVPHGSHGSRHAALGEPEPGTVPADARHTASCRTVQKPCAPHSRGCAVGPNVPGIVVGRKAAIEEPAPSRRSANPKVGVVGRCRAPTRSASVAPTNAKPVQSRLVHPRVDIG